MPGHFEPLPRRKPSAAEKLALRAFETRAGVRRKLITSWKSFSSSLARRWLPANASPKTIREVRAATLDLIWQKEALGQRILTGKKVSALRAHMITELIVREVPKHIKRNSKTIDPTWKATLEDLAAGLAAAPKPPKPFHKHRKALETLVPMPDEIMTVSMGLSMSTLMDYLGKENYQKFDAEIEEGIRAIVQKHKSMQ